MDKKEQIYVVPEFSDSNTHVNYEHKTQATEIFFDNSAE